MNDILKHREDIKKNILKSFKTDLEKSENSSDIEKAKSGVYADTAENRKLNRVGQQYGSKKQEDEPNGEQSSKQEENSGSKNSKSIEEHAKNTSDETLKKVSENDKAPEDLRNAAKKELESRGNQSKQSDEEVDDDFKSSFERLSLDNLKYHFESINNNTSKYSGAKADFIKKEYVKRTSGGFKDINEGDKIKFTIDGGHGVEGTLNTLKNDKFIVTLTPKMAEFWGSKRWTLNKDEVDSLEKITKK